jgi:hypothetical protein
MSEPANDVLPAVDMPAAQVTIVITQSGKVHVNHPSDARLALRMLMDALALVMGQRFVPKDDPPRSRIVPVGAPIPGLRS